MSKTSAFDKRLNSVVLESWLNRHFKRVNFAELFFLKTLRCLVTASPSFLPSMISAAVLYLVPAIISALLYTVVGQTLTARNRQRGRNQVLTGALLLSCLFWVTLGVPTYFARFTYGDNRNTFISDLQHSLMICITGWQLWWPPYDCQSQLKIHPLTKDLSFFGVLFTSFSAFMNSLCLLVVVKKFWAPFVYLWQLITGPINAPQGDD